MKLSLKGVDFKDSPGDIVKQRRLASAGVKVELKPFV